MRHKPDCDMDDDCTCDDAGAQAILWEKPDKKEPSEEWLIQVAAQLRQSALVSKGVPVSRPERIPLRAADFIIFLDVTLETLKSRSADLGVTPSDPTTRGTKHGWIVSEMGVTVVHFDVLLGWVKRHRPHRAVYLEAADVVEALR